MAAAKNDFTFAIHLAGHKRQPGELAFTSTERRVGLADKCYEDCLGDPQAGIAGDFFHSLERVPTRQIAWRRKDSYLLRGVESAQKAQ